MKYNTNSRQKNSMMAATAGGIQQVLVIIFNFVYRTVFLTVLSADYLGINGLFTNVLQIFSLAELGIGTTIVYRLYQPFAEQDERKISALLRFYREIYLIIFGVVCVLGVAVYPLLKYVVNLDEIPPDVNVLTVYVLFVAQSAVSYLFVYKKSLLTGDQKEYVSSYVTTGIEFATYVARIIVLLKTRNYVLTLAIGIGVTLAINYIFSVYITKKYHEVFEYNDRLSREEKKSVFSDTGGTMCHKVGAVVVSSTDNLVISKIIGLVTVGIYSNYSLIVASVQRICYSVFSNFTSSIGNLVVVEDHSAVNEVYYDLLFVNYWISSITTICLFCLLNPFIRLWLGEAYLLDIATVVIICVQFFIQTTRIINEVFISASGLFMKDKIRPLIESALNLVISVVLALRIGICGVLIGTCVSVFVTGYWREPFLLFKHRVIEKPSKYCCYLLTAWIITAVMAVATNWICAFVPMSWLGWFIRGTLCVVFADVMYIAFFHKRKEFKYFTDLIRNTLRKRVNG